MSIAAKCNCGRHAYFCSGKCRLEKIIPSLKSGSVKDYFPNIGMKIIAQGCICEIIGFSGNDLKVRVVENYNSAYKVGNDIWIGNTFLLLPENFEYEKKDLPHNN